MLSALTNLLEHENKIISMNAQFSFERYDKHKIREEYNSFYSKKDFKEFPIAEKKFIYSIIKSNKIKHNTRLLDAGCGTGKYTNLFASQNINSLGIDISEKAIAIAEEKYPNSKFQEADVLNLPFEKQSFDVIFCSGLSIFNERDLFNVKNFVNYLISYIRPGGLFIFIKTSKCTDNWSENKTRYEHSIKTFCKFFKSFNSLKLKEKSATLPLYLYNSREICKLSINYFNKYVFF